MTTYRVGDPDPTASYRPEDRSSCPALTRSPDGSVWFCTFPEEHPGLPHIAGAFAHIAAVWSDDQP